MNVSLNNRISTYYAPRLNRSGPAKSDLVKQIDFTKHAQSSGLARSIIENVNKNRAKFNEEAIPAHNFTFTLLRKNNSINVVASFWSPQRFVESTRIYNVAEINGKQVKFQRYIGYPEVGPLTERHLTSLIPFARQLVSPVE